MLRKSLSVIALCLIGTIFAVPQTIQYQGKLTDFDGVGENDTLDMTFRIYNLESGGASLWDMAATDVPVVHGLFDVDLGPIDLPFDEQYWLEIEVDGIILDPRMQLASSPYSFRAAVADSFTGGVSPWTQDTMVAHWDSVRGIPGDIADGDDFEANTVDTFIAEWDSVRNVPADLADGDDFEANTVDTFIADWDSVRNIPADIVDGDDFEPNTVDTFVAEWDSVRNVPAGFADGIDDIGQQDTMIAHWDSLRGVPDLEDDDWTISGDDMYSAPPGNVGIGTTTPEAVLDITGTDTDGRGIYIHDALGIGDPDTGIVIRDVEEDGIYIDSPGDDGVEIDCASDDGLYVDNPGNNGVEIFYPGWNGVCIYGSGNDGVYISEPGDDGVYIGVPADDGVCVYLPYGDGVEVVSPGGDGYYVINAGDDGVYISNPGGDGVEIAGGADTERGIYIHDASGTGNPDTGIVIRDVLEDGIKIDSPGDDGLWVDDAGDMGVAVTSPAGDGIWVNEAGDDGIYINSPAENGVNIYQDCARGIYIRGRGMPTFSYPDTGIVIRRVDDDGIMIDNPGGDGVAVTSPGARGFYSSFSTNEGIFLDHPGEEGLYVNYSGGHGVNVVAAGDDALHAYQPIGDGVEVNSPGANCFICDGSPHRRFRVSNRGDIYGHTHYSYITDAEGVGHKAPLSAATAPILEHSGGGEIGGGECRVELPGEFMSSVSISGDNPMRVFITPTSPMGDYWVEKGDSYFVVHATESEASFDYRVQARVMDSANRGISPATIAAPEG